MQRALREELCTAIEGLREARNPPESEFLSVIEAAKLAAVSEATVWEWMAGGLKRYGRGRVVRIRRAELLAFLSSNPEIGAEEIDVEEHAVAILRRSRSG